MGTSFGRGGATTFQQDLANSDCIVIQGSNMAECHPVGFRWAMEAKRRGATLIHVDPRFTRTSAMADIHVPIRAGSDIAFLGGIVRYIIENERYFEEYVVNYTNAPIIIEDDFADTEDLDGLFSGWNAEKGGYDIASWQYRGTTVTSAAGNLEAIADIGQAQAGEGEPTAPAGAEKTDPTLQHPRCVFQVLKRHFARYTPEMVEEICGIPPDLFLKVA
nr:molybdopterin-dependent oxidoreductase [Actinomycetota bacterium]